MKVTRPKPYSNIGYSWGLYADELEAALEKESFYARKQKAIRLDVQAENAKLREAAQAVVERCHGLEGYPTGCDLQLLIGTLAALLEADNEPDGRQEKRNEDARMLAADVRAKLTKE